jgi:hypothetical protein
MRVKEQKTDAIKPLSRKWKQFEGTGASYVIRSFSKPCAGLPLRALSGNAFG